jgi:hypothetical protein
MSRRKIEIIIAVVILILLCILLAIFLRQPKVESPDVDTTPAAVAPLPEVNPEDIPAPEMVSAATFARIFVERFGSYSSESDFANVDDILALATPRFQAELESLVEGYRRQLADQDGYTGISTLFIGAKTVSETETSATLLVTTQREESVGSPGNTSLRYQDVEVALVRNGESWLIDDVTWQ